jgi:hypothetical protein
MAGSYAGSSGPTPQSSLRRLGPGPRARISLAGSCRRVAADGPPGAKQNLRYSSLLGLAVPRASDDSTREQLSSSSQWTGTPCGQWLGLAKSDSASAQGLRLRLAVILLGSGPGSSESEAQAPAASGVTVLSPAALPRQPRASGWVAAGQPWRPSPLSIWILDMSPLSRYRNICPDIRIS